VKISTGRKKVEGRELNHPLNEAQEGSERGRKKTGTKRVFTAFLTGDESWRRKNDRKRRNRSGGTTSTKKTGS